MNCIQILGRLTKDPELAHGGNNVVYCRFSVAVPRGYGKDKVTDFFNCTAFGKTAEAINEYVRKGEQICVQGRMEFTVKDKVTYHNVSVSNVTFISSKNNGNSEDVSEQPKRQSQQAKAKEPTPPADDDDEYPF